MLPLHMRPQMHRAHSYLHRYILLHYVLHPRLKLLTKCITFILIHYLMGCFIHSLSFLSFMQYRAISTATAMFLLAHFRHHGRGSADFIGICSCGEMRMTLFWNKYYSSVSYLCVWSKCLVLIFNFILVHLSVSFFYIFSIVQAFILWPLELLFTFRPSHRLFKTAIILRKHNKPFFLLSLLSSFLSYEGGGSFFFEFDGEHSWRLGMSC